MSDLQTDKQAGSFRRRWWLANSAGFIGGHLVYSLVGHGFTGTHGDKLTLAQYAAHTIGLITVAAILFPLQRAALRGCVQVSRARMLIGTCVFIAAFWLGAETLGPPADWILGFTVLGTASWIGQHRMRGAQALWALGAVIGFWIGIAAIYPVGRTAISLGLNPDSVTLFDHTILWLILGGTTGVVGGFVSAWPLSRMFVTPSNVRLSDG